MKKKSQIEVSDVEILEAYKIAALVVAEYGEKYLPLFQRLHKEVEYIIEKNAIKELAVNLVSDVKYKPTSKQKTIHNIEHITVAEKCLV